jgi:hypothetical protein
MLYILVKAWAQSAGLDPLDVTGRPTPALAWPWRDRAELEAREVEVRRWLRAVKVANLPQTAVPLQ